MKSYAIASLHARADETFRTRVCEVIECGVDYLQLRAPGLAARHFSEAAEFCAQRIRGTATRLLIGRRADIALSAGADGVHLPAAGLPVFAVRSIGPKLMVGRSTHSWEGCRAAAAEGADYAFIGPVFAPRSKSGGARILDDEILRAAAAGIPVFVLGGISVDNMSRFRGMPIAGIAAITLYMDDRPLGPIVEAVREL